MLTLKKGINFGGWFSQCPLDETHYKTFLSEDDVKWVAENGFDHIRLPVDYEFYENPAHFEMLDNFFDWCEKANLKVILDLHKAPGYDFNKANSGNDDWLPLFCEKKVQKQFIELWKEIARRYGTKQYVAFELLNEVVDEKYIEPWNKLIKKTVKAIRSITKETTIIYGGALWNSAKTVSKLKKTKDKNTIFTFHYYEPLLFTHQKAYWVPTMDPNLTVEYPNTTKWYKENSAPIGLQGKAVMDYEEEQMDAKFHEQFIQEAIDAANEKGVPLYCGEFGVIDRAPETSTCNWFKDIISVFEKFQIGYSLWNYKELDFGMRGEHYNETRQYLITK